MARRFKTEAFSITFEKIRKADRFFALFHPESEKIEVY